MGALRVITPSAEAERCRDCLRLGLSSDINPSEADNMLVASILLLLSLLVYYLLGRKDETVITCLPTNRNRALLQECQTVKSYDNIPVWGFNGHIQSYFASQIRKGPTYPFEREFLKNRHGGRFGIDWFFESPTPGQPVVCIMPGIAGHTGNDYIKNFIHFCKASNFNVVSWNWPGCGDGNTLDHPMIRTLGDWTDLDVMIDHVRQRCPNNSLYGVGFSLGANLLLRYLGQKGAKSPLTSAIAMSAGYCGRTGLNILRKNKLYSRVLAKKWIDVLNQNAHIFQDTDIDLRTVSEAKTLEELDCLFSLKLLKYEDVEDYYLEHSSLPVLDKIAIPTMLLNALDDPIIHSDLVELAKKTVTQNENLILAHTKYGGHMGWVQARAALQPHEMLWMDKTPNWKDRVSYYSRPSRISISPAWVMGSLSYPCSAVEPKPFRARDIGEINRV